MLYVVSDFLLAVAKILDVALTLYMWIIIARAVLSWVRLDPRNPIISLLYQLTDPAT